MKRGTLFRKVIVSPWLLAIIPSIIIMFFLPSISYRYKLVIEDSGNLKSFYFIMRILIQIQLLKL